MLHNPERNAWQCLISPDSPLFPRLLEGDMSHIILPLPLIHTDSVFMLIVARGWMTSILIPCASSNSLDGPRLSVLTVKPIKTQFC